MAGAPNPGTFTGQIMVNLGYITPDQQRKVENLDHVASDLQKADPNFHKPLYGHTAAGQTDSIVSEYAKQKGITEAAARQALDLTDQPKVALGIKGEKPGEDLERKGGPIDSTLKVQKELRDRLEGLENTGQLTDQMKSPEGMRALTQTVARELGIKPPDQGSTASNTPDRHMDVDGMLTRSAKVEAQPPAEARQADVHPIKA